MLSKTAYVWRRFWLVLRLSACDSDYATVRKASSSSIVSQGDDYRIRHTGALCNNKNMAMSKAVVVFSLIPCRCPFAAQSKFAANCNWH